MDNKNLQLYLEATASAFISGFAGGALSVLQSWQVGQPVDVKNIITTAVIFGFIGVLTYLKTPATSAPPPVAPTTPETTNVNTRNH
jgi:hypothetical protein